MLSSKVIFLVSLFNVPFIFHFSWWVVNAVDEVTLSPLVQSLIVNQKSCDIEGLWKDERLVHVTHQNVIKSFTKPEMHQYFSNMISQFTANLSWDCRQY